MGNSTDERVSVVPVHRGKSELLTLQDWALSWAASQRLPVPHSAGPARHPTPAVPVPVPTAWPGCQALSAASLPLLWAHFQEPFHGAHTFL